MKPDPRRQRLEELGRHLDSRQRKAKTHREMLRSIDFRALAKVDSGHWVSLRRTILDELQNYRDLTREQAALIALQDEMTELLEELLRDATKVKVELHLDA